MKEIEVKKALEGKYLMIDMEHTVNGYEDYDFHAGMKCKINGYPFQLMAENGVLSLEAEAIALTAWKRPSEKRIEFSCGETISIVCLWPGHAKAYETVIPDKVRQQSFDLK